MYVIDVKHYLDEKGGIAPQKGPARKMADFVTSVVAHASDFDRSEEHPGPQCFKCRQRDMSVVSTCLDDDQYIRWHCPACGASGQISNWQETFWDLARGRPADLPLV